MRTADRLLQDWRQRMARPWIPTGAQVLDVGCHQGEFLRSLGQSIGPSIGLDPVARPEQTSQYQLLREAFREPTSFPDACFDAVVLLATLEHISDKEAVARETYRLLRPNGRLIMTVPSLHVDRIIRHLRRLRLLDGMSIEEHHGYNVCMTLDLFARFGFSPEHRATFQLGFNHLFVLSKPLPTRVGHDFPGSLRHLNNIVNINVPPRASHSTVASHPKAG